MTLTKTDLKKLATKADLKKLVTKNELKAAIKKLATRSELKSEMKTPPARRLGVSSSEAALLRLRRSGGSSPSTETGGIRLAADGIKK